MVRIMETQSLALLIEFSRMCDTVHIALVTDVVYFYAVTNFSNPAVLEDSTLYVTLFFALSLLG